MDIIDILEELRKKAIADQNIKEKLFATRDAESPLRSFCAVCRELGYDITPMDIVDAGEFFHASMKRSTNGGGENSPMLDYQDDFYEMFLESIDI
ncbi:MAG: hypothetical protein MJ059_02910 [Lachnospiraceae bacterium]|nr:hypothetical protein [Lachnospiraceae bacterium]